MGLLGLSLSNYEQKYAKLYCRLPAVNVKFRDKLCFSGHQYDYSEISKVWINVHNNKYAIVPKVFYTEDKKLDGDYEVDYIGIYAIGVMELLYLSYTESLCVDGGEQIKNITDLFDMLCAKIFKTTDDVKEVYDVFFDSRVGSKYDTAYNLFFAMRTNYSKLAYRHVMRYATLLMILWSKDPKIFWELFFEIMKFILPEYLVLLKDVIKVDELENTEDSEDVSINLLDMMKTKRDIDFHRISYAHPDNADNIKYITDCRGVAIYASMSLYYAFLFEHGYDPSKKPILKHNDKSIATHIIAKIATCIGNDYQSRFLLGRGINEQCMFDLRGAYHSTLQDKTQSRVGSRHLPRATYEDLILTSIAHQTKGISKGALQDIDNHMHYASISDIFEAIGTIVYTNYRNILSINVDSYEETIKKLETQNSRLTSEIEKQKQKINDIVNNSTNNSEVEQLKEKLDSLQRIIDSKTEIIEQLNMENKDLNAFISNIYSENDEDTDAENDTTEFEVSIEEMVNYLNNFKFLMVGGRFELIQKLNDYGWTNVDQFDGRKHLGAAQLQSSDFYVLNTKFLSHKVTCKIASNISDFETMMYYNGTNPEKLIKACYSFSTNFFK